MALSNSPHLSVTCSQAIETQDNNSNNTRTRSKGNIQVKRFTHKTKKNKACDNAIIFFLFFLKVFSSLPFFHSNFLLASLLFFPLSNMNEDLSNFFGISSSPFIKPFPSNILNTSDNTSLQIFPHTYSLTSLKSDLKVDSLTLTIEI